MGGPYVGTPEHGPLYRNPFLSQPDLYGRSRFPLDYGRDKAVDYRLVVCPYGEGLISRMVSMSMLPSFTEEDVADIIQAIRKVIVHYRR